MGNSMNLGLVSRAVLEPRMHAVRGRVSGQGVWAVTADSPSLWPGPQVR